MTRTACAEGIGIRIGAVVLEANLAIPKDARGVVLFAHGSGSSRSSPRNRAVANRLNDAGIATLLIDLLTVDEDAIDRVTAHFRFDIGLLARRLVGATDWLLQAPETRMLGIGYFGASTGAAAAFLAAVERPEAVRAIVSRGGRPDLAGPVLQHVRAPALLIVGGDDTKCPQTELPRAGRPAQTESSGDRAGCDTPVRGARRAGDCGGPGRWLVYPPAVGRACATSRRRWFRPPLGRCRHPLGVAM
jgi:putative phosphoribosyl transferase